MLLISSKFDISCLLLLSNYFQSFSWKLVKKKSALKNLSWKRSCERMFIHSNVIYKRVVARKIRLTRRFSFISFIEINKINKRMEYLSRLTSGYLVGGKRLLWSGWTVLSGDALSDGCRFNCSCEPRSFSLSLSLSLYIYIYIYIPDFKHRLQKLPYVKKNDWLKNRLRIFCGF